MEKQTIRTFGRRHGKKLSARKTRLMENVLPAIAPVDLPNGAILEIGFGAGEHVRDLAGTHPDKIIVGAEPFANGVAALLSAITDETTDEILPEYKNIRIFPDDVRLFLEHNNTGFSQIWVLHPDPWPKAKHEKRRLLNADFLKLLVKNLMPGGEIIIGTDHWEYFDWIVSQSKIAGIRAYTPDMNTIKTRYQEKNKAGTLMPKYLVLGM